MAMKRGFLNSSKAKERPLGPATVAASSVSKRAAAIKPDIVRPYPTTKKATVDLLEIDALDIENKKYEFPRNDSLIYTTLPPDAKDDEPVTECILCPGSKEVVINTPGFPQPLVHPATPAFRLDTVPGKGMGLFSTRDLKMGDLILSERPLIVSTRATRVKGIPNQAREMFIQHSMDMFEKCCALAVDRMRPENKAAFMALANSHTKDGSGQCVGIMRTNGVGIDGLLPDETNLPSTTCCPNTDVHFDVPSFSYRLYAVRDIPAGEELTFSYVDIEKPTAERQKVLKPYGFVCTCSACTDPSSDARRATFEPSMKNLIKWGMYERTLPSDWMIKKSLQQLVLLTAEKMQQHEKYSEATRAIMEAYICLGDAVNASKWAAKVRQQAWAGTYSLADIELLLDPANTAAYETHLFWRLRVDPPGGKAMTKLMQNMFEYANKTPEAAAILAGCHPASTKLSAQR
ncbi:SET domain-containing protein [Mycena sanguinolenta]|uniref:SET domain-containing protein n=1 Tax=Mycena sanguinolenta TaxID=230812 RepID=A0A8H7D118_9AGAR|nr:SET domain-containing protein [Mycena sanguinolenta]